MSLIEMIIGISIVFVSIVSVVTVYHFFVRVSQVNAISVKAEFLLEEGVEAVRSVRDNSWTNFSAIPVNTEKHLSFLNGAWGVVDENNYIEGFFERKFIITDVYRDADDNIAETGTLDAGTKKVEVFVSWNDRGATTTKSTVIYLANLFEDNE